MFAAKGGVCSVTHCHAPGFPLTPVMHRQTLTVHSLLVLLTRNSREDLPTLCSKLCSWFRAEKNWPVNISHDYSKPKWHCDLQKHRVNPAQPAKAQPCPTHVNNECSCSEEAVPTQGQGMALQGKHHISFGKSFLSLLLTYVWSSMLHHSRKIICISQISATYPFWIY